MRIKKTIIFFVALFMLCIALSACSGAKVDNIKADIYAQVCELVVNVCKQYGYPYGGDVLDSIKIDYEEETIHGDKVTLSGVISYYIEPLDTHYHQPFEARGDLKEGTAKFTEMGTMWTD